MKKLISIAIYLMSSIHLVFCGDLGEQSNKTELNYASQVRKTIYDSLNEASASKGKLNSLEPDTITLINSPGTPISNTDLIKLFNITYDSTIMPEFIIEAKQYFRVGSKFYLLAAMGITNPEDCHLCSGDMNIGLFQYEGGTWNRISIMKNVGITGEYGRYGSFEKFKIFGSKNICIMVGGSFQADGILEQDRAIIGVIDNSLHLIYKGKSFYSDSGKGGHTFRDTNISFIKNGSPIFDLKEELYLNDRKVKTNIKHFNFKKNIYEY